MSAPSVAVYPDPDRPQDRWLVIMTGGCRVKHYRKQTPEQVRELVPGWEVPSE